MVSDPYKQQEKPPKIKLGKTNLKKRRKTNNLKPASEGPGKCQVFSLHVTRFPNEGSQPKRCQKRGEEKTNCHIQCTAGTNASFKKKA